MVLALVMVVAGVWGAPKMKLTWMATGPVRFSEGQDTGGFEHWDAKLCAAFEKANPGVEVDVIFRDVTQGMMSFQALLAAGTPPDVWIEASGNANQYLHDAYAIDFKQYLTKQQLAMYKPESISPYIRNGNYYALPQSQVCGGLAVNLDLLASVGEKMPAQEKWTTDEFLRIARKLKAKGVPMITLMAKDGFVGWDQLWLGAFGAAIYKGGDYSKVAVNTPAGVKALNFLKQLQDEGLAMGNPLDMTDDDSVEMFTTGKVATGVMQNGHTDYWVPEQVKAGKLDKEFAITFVELPHAAGLKHAPTFGYQAIVVAHRSVNEAKNKMTVKLALVAAGKEYVGANAVGNGGFSTIVGFEPKGGKTEKPSYAAIAALAKVAGLFDYNSFGPRSKEVSALWKEPFQAFLRGEVKAEKVLADFEEKANEVLAR